MLNLKEVLISGLPDFEWTLEHEYVLNNQNDEQVVLSMTTKLNQLLNVLFSLEEYHLN